MIISHSALKRWIDEMAVLCGPEKVVWLNGSEEEKEALEKEAFSTGELIPLDHVKWPHCVYHRSALNDVARTEHLTYICTPHKDDAGPTNNWMAPAEAYERAGKIFKGAMKSRTMYVVPFCMGRIGSPFSKIGVQLTDSIYVALNMRIMTHMGEPVLKALGQDGAFTKCLHSKADLDMNRRLILHFSEENTIWSVGSGYGGNALLGKKCLALRIGSYLGWKEGWLAEHMLVMGIEDPHGRKTYLAAAFPSACGKTNLAMLVPPEEFRKKGYKVWTVGDDIAWLRIDDEGVLRAVNPEAGIFGVVPGINSKISPNAMAMLRKNTIFTNVVLGRDKTVWWENGEGPAPSAGLDWRGEPWQPGLIDESGKPIPGAHPNSRFTAPLTQCPSFDDAYYDPQGVPISAILFGGRRASVDPILVEARDWRHGIFMGATMASERTAAQVGKLGEVRFDPMAMLPFCGYNMGDYFEHWLEMGSRLKKPPRIFRVNWFRQDAERKFLWPGFGENLRLLSWMIDRVNGGAPAQETPLGFIPHKKDVDLEGLFMPEAQWKNLFDIRTEEWRNEIENQTAFFEKFGAHLPSFLREEQNTLRSRIG